MISFLFGMVSIALGVWGVLVWHGEFITVLKGLLPVSLFFAGIVAVISGLAGSSGKPPVHPKDHGKT